MGAWSVSVPPPKACFYYYSNLGLAASCCWQVDTEGLTDLWPWVTAAGLTRLAFKRDENNQSLTDGSERTDKSICKKNLSLSSHIIHQLHF